MFGYLRSDNMVWLTAKRASACCCEHSTFLLFCVCVCVCVCVGGGGEGSLLFPYDISADPDANFKSPFFPPKYMFKKTKL